MTRQAQMVENSNFLFCLVQSFQNLSFCKKISWWYPLILLNCQNDCIQIVDSSQVTTFCNNFLLILIFRVNSTCGGGADYHERFSIFSEPAYNNHNGTFNSTIIARSPPAGAKFRSKSQLGGKAFFPL